MTTTSILPPASVAGRARAPGLASTLRSSVERVALAVWRGLEAYGSARATRELQTLRDRWEPIDPVRAQHFHDASTFLAAAAAERRATDTARRAPRALAPHR
jgi:hypothetical protein